MNNVPRGLLVAAVAIGLGGSVVEAETIVRTARVLSTEPIVETVHEPYQECGTAAADPYDPYAGRNDVINQIVGGVVGGAAGSAVGKGSGRDAAAAAGAVIGSELLNPDNPGLTEGEIIGAVAGGLVAHQVGKGSGKTAATATGALIGKIVGGNLQEGARVGGPGRRCVTLSREKKVITGYTVRYEYNDEVFIGRLPYKPGDLVDISVEVGLVENRTH